MPEEPRAVRHPPLTDEQIRAATIGEPTLHDGPIHLAEYDPAWPILYAREAERIRAILGERARRLESGRPRCPAWLPSRSST